MGIFAGVFASASSISIGVVVDTPRLTCGSFSLASDALQRDEGFFGLAMVDRRCHISLVDGCWVDPID